MPSSLGECLTLKVKHYDSLKCHELFARVTQRHIPQDVNLVMGYIFVFSGNGTVCQMGRYIIRIKIMQYSHIWSWDSSVGIATCYGLEGPGIESRWGEIFRTYPDWLRGPPSLLYNGYRVFPGCKGGRGVMLTTHPLLVLRLRKS